MRADDLPIAEPCDASWDGMRRDPGARRFCDACTKHVQTVAVQPVAPGKVKPVEVKPAKVRPVKPVEVEVERMGDVAL